MILRKADKPLARPIPASGSALGSLASVALSFVRLTGSVYLARLFVAPDGADLVSFTA
jgi:hypothetical protein